MPVSHRKFYLRRLMVAKDAEKKAMEKNSAPPNDAVKQAIARPNVKNIPSPSKPVRGSTHSSSTKK